ncbi:hypothetical protein [Undibacterium rugosum]|uniref:Uncharacterized protein n=1 Tax=Undibacterium rugosum TaxID=2762291 RepID=A0A923L0E4_9BURK|nr:hypothetical protein [Undibacterium rugosum]MBC3936726.1 hypothetical protein [Undibacterium rugosum]MBR7779696.1 hypothetical protein [Undibacterium rugosum]
MKTKKTYIAFGILTCAAILAFIFQFSPETHIVWNDEEVGGIVGWSLGFFGILLGLGASFFALLITGLVFASLSAVMVLVFAAVVLAVCFALAPLLLPFLILAGLIMLMSRRKAVS